MKALCVICYGRTPMTDADGVSPLEERDTLSGKTFQRLSTTTMD